MWCGVDAALGPRACCSPWCGVDAWSSCVLAAAVSCLCFRVWPRSCAWGSPKAAAPLCAWPKPAQNGRAASASLFAAPPPIRIRTILPNRSAGFRRPSGISKHVAGLDNHRIDVHADDVAAGVRVRVRGRVRPSRPRTVVVVVVVALRDVAGAPLGEIGLATESAERLVRPRRRRPRARSTAGPRARRRSARRPRSGV